jgi:hypothetical protein
MTERRQFGAYFGDMIEIDLGGDHARTVSQLG